MWNDPIVEEVRKVRNEHAKKFNYNLQAIAADLQKQQRASKRKRELANGNLLLALLKNQLCYQKQRSKKNNSRTVGDAGFGLGFVSS